jgi:hypothetical protein
MKKELKEKEKEKEESVSVEKRAAQDMEPKMEAFEHAPLPDGFVWAGGEEAAAQDTSVEIEAEDEDIEEVEAEEV